MDRSSALRGFIALFLVCITVGAVVQNYQLRERIVKLEPRITKVERITKLPSVNKTVVINRTVVRRPVVKSITTNRPVPGAKGERGAKGRVGREGARGPIGPPGLRGPSGKTVIQTDAKLTDTIGSLQNLVFDLRARVNILTGHVNQLLCVLLRCPS